MISSDSGTKKTTNHLFVLLHVVFITIIAYQSISLIKSIRFTIQQVHGIKKQIRTMLHENNEMGDELRSLNIKILRASTYPYAMQIEKGYGYEGEENYTNAEQAYRSAIKMKPKWTFAYHMLERMFLEKQNNSEKAIDVLREMRRQNITPYYLAYRMGTIYLESKSYKKAEVEFLRAAQLKPGLSQPHEKLADLYYQKGDAASSCTELKTFLKLNKGKFCKSAKRKTVILSMIDKSGCKDIKMPCNNSEQQQR